MSVPPVLPSAGIVPELAVRALPEDERVITFFNIGGAMIHLDEAGWRTGYEDVSTKIEICRRHYAAAGLGAGYVEQYVR